MIDTVIHNDCLTVLRGMADNSVDAIVSDPPAGIAFMGKDWDNFGNRGSGTKEGYDGKPASYYFRNKARSTSVNTSKAERDAFIAFLREVMTEALRVLKPGGHALIWALPRTSHWTATALEDAGFEVRDVITHLFGSGFPKSLDIGRAVDRMEYTRREKAIKQALAEQGFENVVWSTDHE